MRDLYNSIFERRRPEDVVVTILEEFESCFNRAELRSLSKASRHSLKRGFYSYSSMSDVFKKPVGAARQLAKGRELFRDGEIDISLIADSPESINVFAEKIGKSICKPIDKNNFLTDRLNKEQREHLGLEISKRQYNKRFRYLKRLKAKSDTLAREADKRDFFQIGKTSLATRLTFEVFNSDVNTACFIAYYVARCNLRSQFTNQSQVRPYDQVADTLFKKCELSNTTNWFAIAHVFPEQKVLAKITDRQKGELLGIWYAILERIAILLSDVWNKSHINRETMVVKRGNDSSTWNNTASAWNKARDSWIALNYALGTELIIEEICFGKVLRLMAGDVAAWHSFSGGDLEPDTKVWADLPLPWEVFTGEAVCSKGLVLDVCAKHGVDAEKKGWVSPRPKM